MADEKTVDIIIRGKNLTPEAFAAAQKGLKDLGIETETTTRKTKAASAETGVFSKAWKDFTGGFSTSSLAGLAASYLSIQGLTTAGRQMVAFLQDSVTEYFDAEAASNKLTTAMKAHGQQLPGVREGYDALAKQMQRTTVFSDDLITEMEALFVSVGNVGPAQMGKAMLAAANLSAVMDTDLRASTLLLAKSFTSGGEELGRLKQVIGDVVPAGASMDQVLDAINQKFDGAASAQIETYSGKIKQLGNNWNDTKEQIGELIVKSGGLGLVMAAVNFKISETSASLSALREVQQNQAAGLPPHIAALVAFASGHIATTDSVNEMTAALSPHSKAIDGLTPKLGTASTALAAFDASNKENEKAMRASWAATDAYDKKIKGLADTFTGTALAEQVRELRDAVAVAGGAANLTSFEYTSLSKRLSDMKAQGASLTGEFADMARHHDLLNTKMPVTEANVAQLRAAFAASGTSVAINAREFIVLAAAFDSLISSDPYAILKRIPGALGPIEKGLDDATIAAIKLREALALAQNLQNVSDLMASFATNVVGHFSKTGAAALQVGSDVLSIGSSFAAGDWMGAATKGLDLVGQAFGKIFGSQGRDIVKEFAATQGGFDALRATLLPLGDEGERLWKNLTQGVGKNNPQQAQAAVDAITAALDRQSSELTKQAQALADKAAAEEALLDSTKLSWKEAEELVKQYGISTANSGKALEQSKLNEQSEDLSVNWRKLILAGLEFKDVAVGMADETQEFLNRAFKMGLEVPESMRPMLQNMADMGLLTDINGEKMKDLGNIQFSTTPVDRLVTKLDELLSKMFGVGDASIESERKAKAAFDATGDAATDLGSRIHQVFNDMEFEVPVRWNVDELPDGTSSGGWTARGSGQSSTEGFASGGMAVGPLYAHVERGRKEMIGDVSFFEDVIDRTLQRRGINPAVLAGPGGGSGAGGSSVIHNHIYLDGIQIDERIIKVTNNALQGQRIQVPQSAIAGRTRF